MQFSRRFLGIDYGEKRIGIAISDENNVLAFPKEIILNNENIFTKLEQIITKEKITGLVIGESTNFLGKKNKIENKIESFILNLKEKFKIPIHKQKEFLTSVEARKLSLNKIDLNISQAHSKRKRINKNYVDAKAAMLILQRYLDKINRI